LRLDENGGIDSSFGASGVAVAGDGRALAVALDPEGDIVLAGDIVSGRDRYHYDTYAVADERLHTHGTLDQSFLMDPRVFSGPNAGSRATGVAIQADGKIVVSGVRWSRLDSQGVPSEFDTQGVLHELAVGRLLNDGSLDATFGDQGQVYVT